MKSDESANQVVLYYNYFMKFLKNKYVIGIIVIIILIIAWFVWKKENTPPDFTTGEVTLGNVVETVTATGTVTPVSKANLAFEKGGVVSKIDVAVGDHVNAGDAIASLDSASDQADLESEQATLADMDRSLTPDELAVQQAEVASAQTTLNSANTDAINSVHQAYVQVQSALVNYTDSFFSNPESSNPTLTIHTDSELEQASIDEERVNVTTTMNQWSNDLSEATTTSTSSLLSNVSGYIATIKTFMSDLSGIVNDLNSGNPGISQSTVDQYVATMNTGFSTFNSAVDSVASAQTELSNAAAAYTQAQTNYNLKLAGNSADSIASEQAKVDAAKANLSEDTLISPISGVVTEVDPNLGEYVAPGQAAFGVISDGDFEIDAFIPESDIAKISVGNLASTTLDAYGSYTYFQAKVTAIDPAETVLEGVPTYKVTLMFTQNDSRIKSGMTANLTIFTHEVDNVLEIPYRAVTDNNGSDTVQVVNPDGKTYKAVPVEIGIRGFDGSVQIISGLTKGEKIVTYTASS